MEIDVARLAGLVVREVGVEEREGRPARVAIAARTYDTTLEDLWDCLTNLQRIPRWFSPVSGDLRIGGHYAVEGNASGTITACDAPRSFAATWEFMGDVSWLEVELSEAPNGGTTLRLRHAAHVDNDRWDTFGPGAVGVGWELALIGLHLYLTENTQVDAAAFESWTLTDEGKQYTRLSSDDWGRASIAAGTDPAVAVAAAERTRAFYTGEAEPPSFEA